ncbi:hypothetical protein L3Q72_02090 [Vibrio sp. JC009]|uniref:hypothetical protein n=1 Tax=Vibrio sp. JC009 TaxID=2912314 RepID=UPI0023B19CD5|nr:hypothetical protein [Vibrio sp. JC009]WED22219.1 hypothetical protein L3Q72_02090 [Vibrio sp. JC009]
MSSLDSPLLLPKQELKKHLYPVLIFVILLSVISAVKFWPKVSGMDLWDNDDYMRYVQFSEWLEHGHWYLQPMERFNPQDGQIMHWSRLPDIPLAGFTLIFSSVFEPETAKAISMTLVPAIYMLVTVTSLSILSIRLFGASSAFYCAVYAVSSALLVKFIPGSIDHHNIQLAIAALFLALLPLSSADLDKKHIAWLQGLLIALSLWVGVGNVIFYAITLSVFTLMAYFYKPNAFKYILNLCSSAFIFTVVCTLLNRPFSEFFIPHTDAISALFASCLFSGVIFCVLAPIALKQDKKYKIAALFLLGGLSVLPTILLFPEVLSGGYVGYPPLLLEYWLDHVAEAKSKLEYIRQDGFFSSSNIFLIYLPAILSIYFLKKKPQYIALYLVFILAVAQCLFWQNRASLIAVLLGVPLQTLFCLSITEKLKTSLARVAVVLWLSPLFITVALGGLSEDDTKSGNELTTVDKDKISLVQLIKENEVHQELILAPIEYGAILLARTDNHILSAPYHRNIKGNTYTIETFVENDMEQVRQSLANKDISYILIGEKKQSALLRNHSEKGSFINRLAEKELPSWIQLIDSTSSGEVLFKVQKEGMYEKQ